jgi:hypothetical protein
MTSQRIDMEKLLKKNMREQREATERAIADYEAARDAERRAFKAAGGHAYPTEGDCETGMTLRDYFAGQALATIGESPNTPKAEAEFAYRMADAMLARRKVAPRTGDPDDR